MAEDPVRGPEALYITDVRCMVPFARVVDRSGDAGMVADGDGGDDDVDFYCLVFTLGFFERGTRGYNLDYTAAGHDGQMMMADWLVGRRSQRYSTYVGIVQIAPAEPFDGWQRQKIAARRNPPLFFAESQSQ